MDKKHCSGCKNNFYNGNNHFGIKECWSLRDAKLVTKYRIHMNAPMNVKSNYIRVRIPNCFCGGGYSGTGYTEVEKIPSYAK